MERLGGSVVGKELRQGAVGIEGRVGDDDGVAVGAKRFGERRAAAFGADHVQQAHQVEVARGRHAAVIEAEYLALLLQQLDFGLVALGGGAVGDGRICASGR